LRLSGVQRVKNPVQSEKGKIIVKRILLTLALLMALLLTACGGDDEGDEGSDNDNNDSSSDATTQEASSETETTETAEAAPVVGGLAPSLTTDGLAAGSYKYEILDFNQQTFVLESDRVRPSVKGEELEIVMQDNTVQRGVTLYIPPDIQAGEYPITPYIRVGDPGRVSGTLYTNVGIFNFVSGTLIIDAVENNTITGRVAFVAQPNTAIERTFTVQGAFSGIPLAAQ
jgi:hypothetical protein